MYCKLFASLYQGTLRGASHEILVFTNLLAHADRHGHVDKHFRAIAEETGLTVDEVKAAIVTLESPDPESRSPEEGGARITRLDEHRVWGWNIVNYGKYRSIRSEDDRAEQNRLAQQRWRNKHKPSSAAVSHEKPRSAHAEVEGEGEATSKKKVAAAPEVVAIPAHLDVPTFREAWAEWNKERPRARKATTAKRQLEFLGSLGLPAAIASINQSLQNGWQGLFEPKNGAAKVAAKREREHQEDFSGLQAFDPTKTPV